MCTIFKMSHPYCSCQLRNCLYTEKRSLNIQHLAHSRRSLCELDLSGKTNQIEADSLLDLLISSFFSERRLWLGHLIFFLDQLSFI